MLRNATLCERSRFFVKSLSCPFAFSIFDRSIKGICGIERNENNGRFKKKKWTREPGLQVFLFVVVLYFMHFFFLFFPPAVS